jgi:hypothetical protein
MAITDNVRKALADATPLYAAAGTVDLAAEKLRGVPPLIDRLREEAPERLERMRTTDAKVVQDRVTRQAKDVQARLTRVLGSVEVDLRKLRDNAQDFALQQVGRAAEYAVKAGEAYNGLADRGRGAVRTWRGEAAEGVEDLAITIEQGSPSPSSPSAPSAPSPSSPSSTSPGPSGTPSAAQSEAARKPAQQKPGTAKKPSQGR